MTAQPIVASKMLSVRRVLALAAVASAGVMSACSLPTEDASPTGSDAPAISLSKRPQPTDTGAKTYYISSSGNDRNSGTSPSNSWRTLANVNSRRFAAGDVILLQGGAVFSGAMSFDAADRGTATKPIRISSFGTGRATINSGTAAGLTLYNTAGFSISKLVVVGSGRTSNASSGINVYSDLAGALLDYVAIDSLDVSGYGKYGVSIGSWNGPAGFSNVRVTYTNSHDNAEAGFITYAQAPYAHRNVYFGHLKAFNNTGKGGTTYPSGSGIVLSGVTGGTVERSVAWNNGALNTWSAGPEGIWAYDADGVVLQYNESYGNRTAGTADGGGMGLDQNARNSTIQYNYTHGNDGPGILLAHGVANQNHTGNTVRYNVSENDARKNSPGAITLWGRILSTEIYNNTVYLSPSASGAPRAVFIHNASVAANYPSRVHLRNNVIHTTSGLRAVEGTSSALAGTDVRLEGNIYYANGAANRLVWKGRTYLGLDPWRTASAQELLDGIKIGSEVAPQFANPGNGGTIGDADRLATLGAYRLLSTSGAIDRGINLAARFGIATGGKDFYAGALPMGSGYDMGAHEWR